MPEWAQRSLGFLRRYAGFITGTAVAVWFSSLADISLAVVLFLVILVLFFKIAHCRENAPGCKVLYLVFLFVIIVTVSYFVAQQRYSVLFFTPFAAMSMAVALLFNDLIISFMVTVAAAVIIAALNGGSFYLGLLSLVSGLAASLLFHGARRRNTIIRGGVIIGVIQVIAWFMIQDFPLLFDPIAFSHPKSYLYLFVNGVGYAMILIGILPIFEFLFKVATNISLLELADFNHPLLHRLMLEAPGTYHHSLVVGNLSEAACSAIGANALLARIGAYYHDIGKLTKPEYFSENQELNTNKHDNLSPQMSKMLIMNHVKEGLEFAKRSKLNPQIMEFVKRHHGTSLVYYFYRRALENPEDMRAVHEDGFRYPGPKPNSKETAIVLLADSVEAATRSLRTPTPESIKDLVQKIINNKFIDGQLDDCDLTLKDLEKIAHVFMHVLSGIYHTRVTYPDIHKK